MPGINVKNVLICIVSFLAVSCGESQQQIANEELAEEIKSREIRHITPGQITQTAMNTGDLVTQALETALTRKMIDAVPEKGLLDAAQHYRLSQLPGADSLAKAYHVDIKRFPLKVASRQSALNDKAFQLLDAYRYNFENNLPLEANVQQDNGFLLYTAPITINHEVCLKCHGRVGQDIPLTDYQALSRQYQLDSLVNYTRGQPIAIWMLRFNKKELVKVIAN